MSSNEGDVLFHLNLISESSQLLLLVSQTSAKNLNCIVMRLAMVPLCSMHRLCTNDLHLNTIIIIFTSFGI